MPSLTTSEFPKPKDASEFQEMIRDIFTHLWNDDNVQIVGRSGQEQWGVDVYGKPPQSSGYFAIQCKLRNTPKRLTKGQIEKEIKKARSFSYPIVKYIFVTTAPRDNQVQKIVYDLDVAEQARGGFEVQIKFWEDICSYLADYPKLIDKYYKEWAYPNRLVSPQPTSYTTYISENSPLLIGLLIDVSKSMRKSLDSPSLSRRISTSDLGKTIEVIVTKARQYAKTPEGKELASIISLFAYGFGFGSLRKIVTTAFSKLPFRIRQLENTSVPSNQVRNLLTSDDVNTDSPTSTSLAMLDANWRHYQNVIESYLIDVGNGSPALFDALCLAQEIFIKQLTSPHYETPVLIIISNGDPIDAQDSDIIKVCTEIKSTGVQVISLYVGDKNLTDYKVLYSTPNNHWSVGAKRLFGCASEVNTNNELWLEFLDSALQNGWKIPENAKLFIQVNQLDMIEEIVGLILKSI